MFKGLTQRAQRILTVLAQEEARRFHSDLLLPEHVILALLKDGEGIGYKALRSLNLDLADLQAEIEKTIPRKPSGFVLGDVPPSKRGKKILEESANEARNLGHEYIGTEHLLLATVAEQGSVVANYLAAKTVTIEGPPRGHQRPVGRSNQPHERRPARDPRLRKIRVGSVPRPV